MCWRLVLRNRTRYKAVLAGIAVGTAGFIVIQTVGDSVEKKLAVHLEILGHATIIKAEWEKKENHHPGAYDWRDVAQLRSLPHVVAVAPEVRSNIIKANVKNEEWLPELCGVDHAYWKIVKAYASSGRLIGPSDVVGRNKVCVVGKDVVKNLFNGKDPVGTRIQLANANFEVIGVAAGVPNQVFWQSVFVPLTTAGSLVPRLMNIKDIYIKADDWNRVQQVHDEAFALLKRRHKGYENGIKMVYYPKRVKKVVDAVEMVKFFAYVALLATLVLGGLGITNVMLAAVQDRTKEIGLRKALGAKEESILLQFLTESTMIGFAGGVLGVVLGVVSVQLLQQLLRVQASTEVMLTSIFLGLIFTAVLGIASGMYPSLRASRLDSVTAMRFE
jgi:putative ABC transport system permease protein